MAHCIRIIGFFCLSALLLSSRPEISLAGGTSGGGGNVQPADRVSNASFFYAMRRSRIEVGGWLSFQFLEYQKHRAEGTCDRPFNARHCYLLGKLFDTGPTAIDLLPITEVEMKVNDACYDADGNPTDGSVHGTRPGSICLSLARLREKLLADNYENQVAALALHELTHLKGTTEEEANDLQKMMLDDFLVANFGRIFISSAVMDILPDEVPSIYRDWKAVAGDLREGCRWAEDTTEKLRDFYRQHYEVSGFRLLTPEAAGDFWALYMKARSLQDYVCSQDELEKANKRDFSAKNYADNFAAKDEIFAVNYRWNYLPEEKARELTLVASLNLKINRISGREDFLSQLDEIIDLASLWANGIPHKEAKEFKTYKTK